MKIYKIINKINNKIYIGKTNDIEKRIKRHLRSVKNKVNRYLYDAINHYGWENFDVEIIEECTDSEANEKEKFYIRKNQSNLHEFGYNMTSGGDGVYTLSNWSEEERNELYKIKSEKQTGFKHSNETRKKMSESKKGIIFSNEHKNKLSENHVGFLGKKHSNSTKEKISKKNSGRIASKECRKKISDALKGKSYRKNYIHSDETRQKISDALKGRKLSDETKDKMSKSKKLIFGKNHPLYGRKLSDETKRKISESLKRRKK